MRGKCHIRLTPVILAIPLTFINLIILDIKLKGQTDYLAERLAIVGNTEEVIQRIKTLESQDVDKLFFYTALPDKQRLFNQLAEEVLPAVG